MSIILSPIENNEYSQRNSHFSKWCVSKVFQYISNGFVSSKIYDKRDDFVFDIVNFPFLDGDVPRRPSNGVYISQLIRFARVCSHVTLMLVNNV